MNDRSIGLPSLLLWGAILAPFVGSWLTPRVSSDRRRRQMAIGFAMLPLAALFSVLTACFGTGSLSGLDSGMGMQGDAILNATPLTLILAVAMAAGYFALQLASPTRLAGERSAAASLLMEGLALISLFAMDLRLLFFAWVLLPAPFWKAATKEWQAGTRRRSGYFLLQAMGSGLFLVAVVCLGFWQREIASRDLFDLRVLSSITLGGQLPVGSDMLTNLRVIGGLLSLAAFVRQGLFPFQTGLLALAEWAPLELLSSLLISQSGLVLLLRVAVPLLRSVLAVHHLGLMILAIIGLCYFALLSLARTDGRRLLTLLWLSESSLCLIGIASGDSLGYIGEGLQWVSSVLTAAGLGIALWCLELRTGIRHGKELTGLAKSFPVLGALALCFGLATVHVPLTLGFVSEDLLIHALLQHTSLFGMVALTAMAFLGMAVFRYYFAVFLGPAVREFPVPDLKHRERVALLGILILVVGLGLFPHWIVRHMGAEVTQLGAWGEVREARRTDYRSTEDTDPPESKPESQK